MLCCNFPCRQQRLMHRKQKQLTINKNSKTMRTIILTLIMAMAFVMTPCSSCSAAAQTDTLQAAVTDTLQQTTEESAASQATGAQLEQYRLESRRIEENMEHVTGMLATIMPFVVTCIIVALAMWHTTKRRSMKYDMVNHAIEKGYQLPEYVFAENEKRKDQYSSLKTAVWLISAGLCAAVMAIIVQTYELLAISLVPLLSGAGYFVIYIMSERKKAREEKEKQNCTDNADQN